MRPGLAWNGKSEKDKRKEVPKAMHKMLRKTNENHSKIFPDPPKIMLLVALGCCCDVLGCLGSALVHLGVILGRSWDVLGQSCKQTWSQDGAQMVQVGLKMAILMPFGELC